MRITTASLLLLAWMAAAWPAGAAQLSQTPAAPESSTETAPVWDPLKANKDMEVGTFYFKRGNYEAALERFKEAAKMQPGVALPYMKLGETYEKKNDLPMALASYRKYLDLYRDAPDANTVRKRIESLEKQIARDAGPPATK